MSGICGIIYFDGTAVEPSLLQDWTNYLAYRGPDDRGIWYRDNVGLGHTLLRTTPETAPEAQPYGLNEQIYITADVRLDDRSHLIAKLQSASCPVQASDSDGVLLLYAYQVWGEKCLEHLLGDFAFALWDARQQRLFCARDPFGVKPFFYTWTGRFLAFSNTLNCLRLHPDISNDLNELAIADFLLFDTNQDLETTTFKDIQRLQAAHTLSVTPNGKVQKRRYWAFQLPQQIRLHSEAEYLEGFHHYLDLAVRDRTPPDKVAVMLSGGLDSSAIALSSSRQTPQPQIHAFTVIYRHLIPDCEEEYAQSVTDTLQIPHHCFAADDYALYQDYNHPDYRFPEPQPTARVGIHFHWLQQMAQNSRVAFYGQGGDEGFKFATVSEALRGMSWLDLGMDVWQCWQQYRLRPPWGTGLRNLWQKRQNKSDPCPIWLNEDFVNRWQLGDRIATIQAQYRFPLDKPPRSRAFHSLPPSPLWNLNFETYDPGVSRLPLEVRLPFLDLRLLNYLLSLPPIPWCVDKTLLRLALREKLPSKLCDRPKTPLSVNPVVARLQQGDRPWQILPDLKELDPYVNRQQLQEITSSKMNSQQVWQNLRPLNLGYWLQQLAHSKLI